MKKRVTNSVLNFLQVSQKRPKALLDTFRTLRTLFEICFSVLTICETSQMCQTLFPTPRNCRTLFRTLCWTLFNEFSNSFTRLVWPIITMLGKVVCGLGATFWPHAALAAAARLGINTQTRGEKTLGANVSLKCVRIMLHTSVGLY